MARRGKQRKDRGTARIETLVADNYLDMRRQVGRLEPMSVRTKGYVRG